MRLGKIALLSAFVYASVANAQDVMVDLSVLDDLDTPKIEDMRPLFPIISKKTDIKTKKLTKKVTENKGQTSKRSLRKRKAKKPVEMVKPLDADAVVVDVEPVSAPTPVKIEENSMPQPVVAKPAEVAEQPTPTVSEEKEPSKVVAGEIETVVEVKDAVEEKATETTAQDIAQTTPEVVKPVVVEPKEELLVKDEVKIIEKSDYIKFADDADELDEAQEAQIDLIVSAYENGPRNKIAIYSYNLDNGVDSFKRKRTSLNRAVNVRSYLLKKGYKNFSIKVININNASDKKNMVELQEI